MNDSRDELLKKIAAEGNASGDFTPAEKMALVANELMAPEAIGLSSAEDARLQILPPEKREPEFGNIVEFAAGVVPLVLRAQWALQETKIILAPTDKDEWIEKWIAEHKNEYYIQGKMHCGSLLAQFQRTYKDPILGLAAMLRLCGDMLEQKYLGEEIPPSTETKPEKKNG